VYGNQNRLPPGGIEEFLGTRVTVLNAAFAGLFMLTWGFCFNSLHLYSAKRGGILRTLVRIAKGCALMTLLLTTYLYGTHTRGPVLRIAIAFFVASFCYESIRVTGGRLLRTWIASRDPQVVIILGSGRRAGKAWRQIRTQYHDTVKLLGFVDDRDTSEMAPDVADRYLGSVDQLSELLLRNVVDELLIALPAKSCYETIERSIVIAEEVGVEVVYMHDVYSTTRKHLVGDEELFSELVPQNDNYVTRQAVKRFFDVTFAALALVLLAPLFLIIAIAIKLTSKGSIFFVQHRYGYRRRLFPMYKFRSMVREAPELMAQLEDRNEAVGPIFKMRNDPRVYPLGRLLRVSSMDELPQLWNVLKGDMSLVGPRPMSIRDVSLFTEATLMRRFSVKPGITGLWQISGRSGTTFDQWIKLDFSYIDSWSLGLDLWILARTIPAVVRRSGAV
jgi:exopolysaccharide biosynthesis polyprenyl glycosylphosphotransferase